MDGAFSLFKKYHIVIIKDREGGISNLRLPGWLAPALFLLVAGLAALNLFLWEYYTRSLALEYELTETRQALRTADGQMLHLAGRTAELEESLNRVMRFDAKLRVLMNIGDSEEGSSAGPDDDQTPSVDAFEPGPLLARHRELFARRSFSVLYLSLPQKNSAMVPGPAWAPITGPT